jgi:hypothetical protein
MRKAFRAMTLTHASAPRPRRLRAAFIGFGLDNADNQQRLTRSDQSLILGGSEETHAHLQETAVRMESELERLGRDLGDLDPSELADLATIIGSPELLEIAFRLEDSLIETGRSFQDLTPEELTELSNA